MFVPRSFLCRFELLAQKLQLYFQAFSFLNRFGGGFLVSQLLDP
jgi:hypothetical protein